METREYEIDIAAPAKAVWDTLLDPQSCEKWIKAWSEQSSFMGKWGLGEQVSFFDPTMGGTKAVLDVFKPMQQMVVRHIAILNKHMQEDTVSEEAKRWVGCLDDYRLETTAEGTRLKVSVSVHESFLPMFDATWPKALEMIKQLSEQLSEAAKPPESPKKPPKPPKQ